MAYCSSFVGRILLQVGKTWGRMRRTHSDRCSRLGFGRCQNHCLATSCLSYVLYMWMYMFSSGTTRSYSVYVLVAHSWTRVKRRRIDRRKLWRTLLCRKVLGAILKYCVCCPTASRAPGSGWEGEKSEMFESLLMMYRVGVAMEFMVVHEQYILAVYSKTNAKHISIRQFISKATKKMW